MSALAEPQPQAQTHPDSLDSSQEPVAQTASRAPVAAAPPGTATPSTLDHDHFAPAQHSPPPLQHHQQLHHQHHHQHHQHHQHIDGPTATTAAPTPSQLEAANIAHFDALSHDFDKQHPFAAEFADRFSRALRRHCSTSESRSSTSDGGGGVASGSPPLILDEDATSVLDYACGSGQVSRALAPYVAQLVGVDISPRMVEVNNTRASTQGLEPHEMRAVSSLAELQQQRFDLAVCSMAYHHFASVEQVTRELVYCLKPGAGMLAVADIARVPVPVPVPVPASEEEEAPPIFPPEYAHLVSHMRGFTEEDVRALFEGAGLVNFTFELFTSAKRDGRDVHFFLATGTKPAQSFSKGSL